MGFNGLFIGGFLSSVLVLCIVMAAMTSAGVGREEDNDD
jgi:hypothetical protein